MQHRSHLESVAVGAFSLLILFCLGAGVAFGQERYWGSLNFETSREMLELALSHFENAALSQAYSTELRAHARSRARDIRSRLQEGDFRVGDRFLLVVEGDSILTDTFTVGVERKVYLPNIGDISLQGVLRSELDSHIGRELARFLAEPVIRARSLVRIAVLGSINEPGYYRVPIETPITDVIMLVGGPTDNANLKKAHLDRYGDRIWLGPELEIALREGKTLDEIKMLPGDEVIVPSRPTFSPAQILGLATGVLGVLFGLRLRS